MTIVVSYEKRSLPSRHVDVGITANAVRHKHCSPEIMNTLPSDPAAASPPEGAAGDQEISDKRVVPFIYAGLQGRFDLLGTRERRGGTLVGAK